MAQNSSDFFLEILASKYVKRRRRDYLQRPRLEPEPLASVAIVVQGADRLDALGAIGIARCLLTGGALGSDLYHPDDPFCTGREPDDRAFMADHFYTKLFKRPDTMQTSAGRAKPSGA